MSKGSVLETLLRETNVEKLLRRVHALNPSLLISWFKKDEKNFNRLTDKVALVMKKNRKLVRKIQREEEKHATVQAVR